jgi:isopenicillin N synthase-like dioxygenase
VHKAIRLNQNESFFVTHDRGPDHPDTIAGKPLRGRNQWPPGLPGLRADMMAYFDALRAMCDRMLPPFVMALASPIVPGTFLINLGNIMRRWSNDRFLSTPHGVINKSGTDRYSIAYFHSPNPDAIIECAPTCTGVDNPPRYPAAIYRDLVLEVYRAN